MQSLSQLALTAPFTKGSLGKRLLLFVGLPQPHWGFAMTVDRKGDLATFSHCASALYEMVASITSFPCIFVPSIPPAPAAADTISLYLDASRTVVDDYDMIFTGDLGRVGSRLLRDLLEEKGINLGERHSDCGVMIFDESQDVHAGGSGCGCCASVLCGFILDKMREGVFHNILFVPTGALLSPTTVMQKQSILSIAHLINLRVE